MSTTLPQCAVEQRTRCRELATILDHDGAVIAADVIERGKGTYPRSWTVAVVLQERFDAVPVKLLETIAARSFGVRPEPPRDGHQIVTLVPAR